MGVVSQTETAALKAISTTKAQPFNRDLTALYTPGTYISPDIFFSFVFKLPLFFFPLFYFTIKLARFSFPF